MKYILFLLLYVAITIVQTIFCGSCIKSAIQYFKKDEYFKFGCVLVVVALFLTFIIKNAICL